jgi:hypothetical protein
MSKIYFATNAVLYFALALLCTFKHRQTSRGTGFTELNNSGHSEYLVIYGGLQMGLALFYAWLARDAQLARVGIVFSVLLYAPIVLYRVATVLMYKPVSNVTLGTAALEVVLLIWGAWLLRTV